MGKLKVTIFACGGLRLLQMVSKLDTRQCASENAGAQRGVDCEIPHRLEGGTSVSKDAEP